MKVNGCLSPGFVIERGVRQGSVLSPALFPVLIDSLLEKLRELMQELLWTMCT